jgi:flagellar L-ring protein FlgH
MTCRVRLVFFALICASSPVLAQPRTSPVGASTSPPPRQTDPKPHNNNNDAQTAGATMQRNGGSLLKATLSAPVDPGQAPLGAVSFFAVPEPEPRVIKKHDLVTVIIREESEFKSEGQTETKKEAALEARIDEFVKLNLKEFTLSSDGLSNPLVIRGSGNREFNGEGSVDRSDSFTARVTVEVLDVKPNGNLVLQGRKSIVTDDEVQKFLITGTCRAEDVSADNTVLSTQLKDFDLRKTHKGNVRNATQKGWAGKLLDALNPF